MLCIQGVRDKFDSFIRENKKCLVTTFNRLKINSTGSEITLLSTSLTQDNCHCVDYSFSPAPEQADVTLSLGRVSKTALIQSINCFCSTGTAIGVFLNSVQYIITHGVKICGVRRPNIGTDVVVKICQQPFFTFPRGVAGGRILLPYIWPTIGYPCYPGLNYSD